VSCSREGASRTRGGGEGPVGRSRISSAHAVVRPPQRASAGAFPAPTDGHTVAADAVKAAATCTVAALVADAAALMSSVITSFRGGASSAAHLWEQDAVVSTWMQRQGIEHLDAEAGHRMRPTLQRSTSDVAPPTRRRRCSPNEAQAALRGTRALTTPNAPCRAEPRQRVPLDQRVHHTRQTPPCRSGRGGRRCVVSAVRAARRAPAVGLPVGKRSAVVSAGATGRLAFTSGWPT
jgi:hypothetical protein